METPRPGRHTVYVGTLPADCRPTSPIDLPAGLVDLQAHVEGLTLSGAIAELRYFNRTQLGRGIPDGRWAVLGFCPRHGGQTEESPHCRLVVEDEVSGAPTIDTILPESPDDVLKNCTTAARALEFAEMQEFRLDDDLAVAIAKGPAEITIRWHAVGDLDAARRRLAEVREGRALA